MKKPVGPPNRVMREGCRRGVTHGDCDQHTHHMQTCWFWAPFVFNAIVILWMGMAMWMHGGVQ